MGRRTRGKTAGDGKSQIWLGLPLLPVQEFVEWAMSDPTYDKLYNEWVQAEYQRGQAPSVHRIDRDGGYTIGNIEFRKHVDKARESLAKGKETMRAKRANS
jgi:hypothetical protein